MPSKVILGRHETFPLRDGWTAKALNALSLYGKDTFDKEKGMRILGLGSNMVRSLRFWLKAGGVLEKFGSAELTEFGKTLLEYDPYMISSVSWNLYHLFLTRDPEYNPVFSYIFSNISDHYIREDAIEAQMKSYLSSQDREYNEKNLKKDIHMFFLSYSALKNNLSPEDNMVCPLSRFHYLEPTSDGKTFHFINPNREDQFYLIVFYALALIYNDSFDIGDAFNNPKGPARLFRMTEQDFQSSLMKMESAGLVTVNRTANLNAVYLHGNLALSELYERWNMEGGKAYVQ